MGHGHLIIQVSHLQLCLPLKLSLPCPPWSLKLLPPWKLLSTGSLERWSFMRRRKKMMATTAPARRTAMIAWSGLARLSALLLRMPWLRELLAWTSMELLCLWPPSMCYKPVQMGLSMATIVPVASIQRAARAARRAGTKNIEGAVDSSPSVINTINSVLSYLGFQLVRDVEDASKPHLEPGTEPFTPEQEFGEMTLSDYDSDEDADYEPSDSESSEDELEYNSDASEDELEEEISGGDAEIANV